MALELVFECPRTLTKLRSGPLGKLLDGFCDWLLEHGFTRHTVRKHLANVSHFNEYLGARNRAGGQTLSSQDVNIFLRAYWLRARNRGPLDNHVSRVRFSASRFIEYLRSSGLFEHLADTAIYQPLRDTGILDILPFAEASGGSLSSMPVSLLATVAPVWRTFDALATTEHE